MDVVELEIVFLSIDLYELPPVLGYQSTTPHPVEQVVDDNIFVLSLLRLLDQSRQVGYTVLSRRRSNSHPLRQGRHEVVVSTQVIRLRTGRDAARPAKDHRTLHATLIAATLQTSPAPGSIKDIAGLRGAPFFVRQVGLFSNRQGLRMIARFRSVIEFVPIVRREEYNCVVIDPKIFELSHKQPPMVI